MPPPIIAYHVVFGAYGFWLPNDPRGSWSRRVWSQRLARFGPVKPANTRRSVAGIAHDRRLRLAAKQELAHPPVRFNGRQALCIAAAVAEQAAKYSLPIYAAAFMPDHVHLVTARQSQTAEQWTGYFKRAASRSLLENDLHPFADFRDVTGRLPTVWADGGWKVFLHTPTEIRHAIEYVEHNPTAAGLKGQRWSWLTPYVPPRGRGG